MSRVDTVLFDLGGVLVSDPWESLLLTPRVGLADRIGLARQLMEQVGRELWEEYRLRVTREDDYWSDLSRALGVDLTPELVRQLESELLVANVFAGTILNGIREAGITIGVVSEATSFWYPKQVLLIDLDRYLEPTQAFLSFQLGVGKENAPRGLFEIAAEAVDPHNTLVIDDRRRNLERASSIGFQSLEYSLGWDPSAIEQLVKDNGMGAVSNRGGGVSGHAGNPIKDEMVRMAVPPTLQAGSAADLGRAQLDALLAEYASLRQESMNAIANRITIMNFTFGALAIVLAGLLATRVPTLLAGITALLFVPQVAKAALLIWLGEYNRSQRAGRRIQDLESWINVVVGAEALGWETELANKRTGRGHMSYPYWATVSLVIGAGYAGTMIGFYLLVAAAADRLDALWIAMIVLAIAAYALILETSFLIYFMTEWRAAVSGTTNTTDKSRLERALRRGWSRIRGPFRRSERPREQGRQEGPPQARPASRAGGQNGG
jgi:beta-phosphoglucomutase-like phosphatase (HAD superfamily)